MSATDLVRPERSLVPPALRLPGWRPALVGVGLALLGLAVIGGLGLAMSSALDADSNDLAFALVYAITAILFEGWLLASSLLALHPAPISVRLNRLGLRAPALDDVWLAFAALASAFVVLIAYTALVSALGVEALEPDGGLDERLFETTAGTVLIGATVVVAAPLAEEVFYRGLLLGGLASALGAFPALFLSGAVFAASHQDPGVLVPITLIGVILGVVYFRGRSLWLAVLTHALFNAISFVVALNV